jgi:two-component system, OmpR family, KDP operon response regulator KdpE
MSKILIIDDEPQIRRFLRVSLNAGGYETVEAETGQGGVEAARTTLPDLIVLDLGLPDIDGLEVISNLRAFSAAPIIVLSVRAQEYDKVEALDRGAVDYVVKPFSVGELTARIRAALRRPTREEAPPAIVTAGRLTLDLQRRVVTLAGEEIRLSRKEYELLAFLGGRADRVATHGEILRAVWGPAHVEDTVYLRIYVKQLRAKLEANPERPVLIVTEPGVGYRFKTAAE